MESAQHDARRFCSAAARFHVSSFYNSSQQAHTDRIKALYFHHPNNLDIAYHQADILVVVPKGGAGQIFESRMVTRRLGR